MSNFEISSSQFWFIIQAIYGRSRARRSSRRTSDIVILVSSAEWIVNFLYYGIVRIYAISSFRFLSLCRKDLCRDYYLKFLPLVLMALWLIMHTRSRTWNHEAGDTSCWSQMCCIVQRLTTPYSLGADRSLSAFRISIIKMASVIVKQKSEGER